MRSMLPALIDLSNTLSKNGEHSLEEAVMPYIYAAAYRILENCQCDNTRKLAKSLSMVIFKKLSENEFAALGAYDQRKCSFEAWLSTYAERISLTYIRQCVYPASRLSVIFAAMGLDVAGKEEEIDRQGHILEPTHKFVLRLLYDERMDFDEAAAVLGVAPRVVRSIEFEAMERIRMACRPTASALAQ